MVKNKICLALLKFGTLVLDSCLGCPKGKWTLHLGKRSTPPSQCKSLAFLFGMSQIQNPVPKIKCTQSNRKDMAISTAREYYSTPKLYLVTHYMHLFGHFWCIDETFWSARVLILRANITLLRNFTFSHWFCWNRFFLRILAFEMDSLFEMSEYVTCPRS